MLNFDYCLNSTHEASRENAFHHSPNLHPLDNRGAAELGRKLLFVEHSDLGLRCKWWCGHSYSLYQLYTSPCNHNHNQSLPIPVSRIQAILGLTEDRVLKKSTTLWFSVIQSHVIIFKIINEWELEKKCVNNLLTIKGYATTNFIPYIKYLYSDLPILNGRSFV